MIMCGLLYHSLQLEANIWRIYSEIEIGAQIYIKSSCNIININLIIFIRTKKHHYIISNHNQPGLWSNLSLEN